MKKKFLLPLNIQFFADGEEEDFKTIDDEIAEFEREWSDEAVEEEQETTEEDPQEKEQQGEENVSDQSDEPSEVTDTQKQPPKENEAWKNLRKELQEKSKYAAIVEQLAKQNGMTPDEIVQQFEQRQLQQEAEKQNVPVDVLQRLKKLEEDNKSLRQQQFTEKFNGQVESVKEKYKLSEDEIRSTIDHMAKNGFDPERVAFEDVYKLVNFDKILEAKVHETRQKELAEKKKRQESAPIPNGEGVSPQDSEEITDEFVDQMLKKMNLSI